jgi:hypothetical protein
MSGLEADPAGLADRPDRAPWHERFRWRAMIAWFHFLEPLARDWGRLKGGLTPWRSALERDEGDAVTAEEVDTPWWRRLNPFRRKLHWTYPGDMRLEKDTMLERLTAMLNERRCSVGWNSNYDRWDLVLRRGALGQAWMRMVVEHHGGPRRLARFATEIRPSRTVAISLAVTASLCFAAAWTGLVWPTMVLAAVTAALWIAPVREADRIERGLRAATDELCAGAV